jgi:hypothetical protein
MKNLAPRMVVACMLILMLPIAAFGQQSAKDPFNSIANVQNAATYNDRGLAKQKMGVMPSERKATSMEPSRTSIVRSNSE